MNVKLKDSWYWRYLSYPWIREHTFLPLLLGYNPHMQIWEYDMLAIRAADDIKEKEENFLN